jgi:hypothetical protein
MSGAAIFDLEQDVVDPQGRHPVVVLAGAAVRLTLDAPLLEERP